MSRVLSATEGSNNYHSDATIQPFATDEEGLSAGCSLSAVHTPLTFDPDNKDKPPSNSTHNAAGEEADEGEKREEGGGGAEVNQGNVDSESTSISSSSETTSGSSPEREKRGKEEEEEVVVGEVVDLSAEMKESGIPT